MRFREFYNRYARHAGFGIKTGQANGKNKYLQCSREGVTTSNLIQIRSARYAIHHNPRTIVVIHIT
jgi:hypothetical protein